MADLEAGERFYSGLLGLPIVERWSSRGGAIWLMAGDRTRIGLWRPQIGLGGGRGGVHVHYSMQLPAAAYDAAIPRLRAGRLHEVAHRPSAYRPGPGLA